MQSIQMEGKRVCVTGAAGYIGSWLVKKLLNKGHVVHATLRNLEEKDKVGLLKSLPGAETRLRLFEADLYDAEKFELAMEGCESVFLLATPLQHNRGSHQYKDPTEAAVDAIRRIMLSCETSGSVKRVIYTGSVTAASPLNEEGSGYNDFIDESYWTPLHLSFAYCEDFEKFYTCSKALSEKEILSFNSKEGSRVEVVSLVCGLVGGDTILPYVPRSVQITVSPLTAEPVFYRRLMFLQALLGSVPLIHIEDVCEALVFSMEMPSMAGRFLCAASYPTMKELLGYYERKYPAEVALIKKVEGGDKWIQGRSAKLVDMGFRYKYDVEKILEDSVECAKRLGDLQ